MPLETFTDTKEKQALSLACNSARGISSVLAFCL